MKKYMIRPIILVLLLAFAGSCKKDGSIKNGNDKAYYIKLKLNGAQKQYAYNATSLLSKPSGIYACAVNGNLSASNPAGVTIGLTDGDPFVTGKTYTEQLIVANGVTTIQGTFTFKDDDGTIYFASGTTASTSLTLQFSEIGSDHLRGTFSGKALKVGSSPLTYASFTEGEFYVGRSL